MALALDPLELGLSPDSGRRVWGVVMDTAMGEDEWYSLLVLADGTTSLYTSATFGVIGAGTHPGVRVASDRLLATTEEHLDRFGLTADNAIPPPGMAAIRALTFDGQLVVVAAEDEFGHGRHAVSPVFYAAHAVIGEIRQVTPGGADD
jgi:hypothetical protein